MKKKTRKNCKKGGSRSSSRSSFSSYRSSNSDAWENWKTDHPEIMTAYNDVQSTKGSLSIGVIGGMLTAALFGFIIYKKVK